MDHDDHDSASSSGDDIEDADSFIEEEAGEGGESDPILEPKLKVR